MDDGQWFVMMNHLEKSIKNIFACAFVELKNLFY